MHGIKSNKQHLLLKPAKTNRMKGEHQDAGDLDYAHFKSYGKNKTNHNAMSEVEREILDWQEEMQQVKT